MKISASKLRDILFMVENQDKEFNLDDIYKLVAEYDRYKAYEDIVANEPVKLLRDNAHVNMVESLNAVRQFPINAY